MKKYEAYKDSGVEWIGEIPEEWEKIRLAFTGKFSKGSGVSKADLSEDGFPVVLYGDIYTRYDLSTNRLQRFISKEVAKTATKIKNGDLLLTASGETKEDIGKCIAYTGDEEAYAGGDVIILTPKNFNSLFLSYVLNSEKVRWEKAKMSRGEIVVHIYSSILRDIFIPFPSFHEQATIANYLEQKTSQLNKLIAKKERLIELLQEERTAIINHAVTKGLDSNVPMKDSGIEWLGEIPEHWKMKRLKYLARIRYGLGQPPKQKVGGLPIIRATNVFRGSISEVDMLYVDPDDLPMAREPILKLNDIIVVRSGAYTADSAIITEKWIGSVTGYDMVVTANKVDPKLLSFVFLSTYMLENQLFLQRLRAAQPHLNSEELGETFFVLPPPDEQIKIVKWIERGLEKVAKVIEKVKTEIELLKEYKTALISEVVTGKVDVRNEILN